MTQSSTIRSKDKLSKRRAGFLHKFLRHPPHRLVEKFLKKTVAEISNISKRSRDANRCTYSEWAVEKKKLQSYFPGMNADFCQQPLRESKLACQNYLEHKFDLLGSGWVQVSYEMTCRGFRGFNYSETSKVEVDRQGEWLQGRISNENLSYSRMVWNLLDDDYIPFDWQRDFISGYRWSDKTWYKDIPLGHMPGVDVKIPWELARMQHLPQMAICNLRNLDNADANSFCHQLQREFRNEVLDFIATNPPRFGVNWNCSMDAGIRIANWLLARDLFLAAGVKFDEEFEAIFAASVYDHAIHIFENLENTCEVVGNHYLANLAGLFFTSAFLPSDMETNRWLNFSWSELLREIDRQFLPDGANFEGSTCYHCLSSEMLTWCIALHDAIDSSRFSDEHRPHCDRWQTERGGLAEKISKMGNFIQHCTKPNGNLHQVGDNDSGRFFKLNPQWKVEEENNSQVLQENRLDYRSVLAAIEGLFLAEDESRFDNHHLESKMISSFRSSSRCKWNVPARKKSDDKTPRFGRHFTLPTELEDSEKYRPDSYHIPIEDPRILEHLETYAYPDFGLYIWKSSRCYIAVRCGSVGQNGVGGHAHCDQLAIEMNFDGVDIFADPGSCTYTADAELRNTYRSVRAHRSPQLRNNTEPASLDAGLFRLDDTFDAKCLYFGQEGFLGSHRGYGPRIYRSVRIGWDTIEITDYAPLEFELVPMKDVLERKPIPFSAGYGRSENPI